MKSGEQRTRTINSWFFNNTHKDKEPSEKKNNSNPKACMYRESIEAHQANNEEKDLARQYE